MNADKPVEKPALGKAQQLPPVKRKGPRPGFARRLLTGKRARRGR